MARADQTEIPPAEPGARRRPIRTALVWIVLGLLALAALAALITWLSRERIAGNLIDQALEDQGLKASYDIGSIGAQEQVLENLVIGDPAAPDFTAQQVVVGVIYNWGAPEIGPIRIERPRLFGTYREGVLSFGALDPVLFAESEEPAGIPALDIAIVDGGAQIETEYGTIGLALNGAGLLTDGFTGTLAATAPGLGVENCRADTATLYGTVAMEAGAPRFEGPLRVRDVTCAGVTLARADFGTTLRSDADFAGVEADIDFAGQSLMYGGAAVSDLDGEARVTFGPDGLRVVHDLSLAAVETQAGALAMVRADGSLRSDAALETFDWKADLTGEGADFATTATSALTDMRSSTAQTMLEPLIAKLQRNLASAARGGVITAQVNARSSPQGQSITIPLARFRAGSGDTLLAVSRASLVSDSAGTMRLQGNFATAGEGLPQINGRMEQVSGGALGLRMTMAEYRADASRLAVPRMEVRQDERGVLRFDGRVEASGAIPGGSVTGLEIPINGAWAPGGAVAIASRCETVRFASLTYYDLTLDGRSTRLCPVDGKPMLRYGETLALAAQTSNIALAGALGETPMALTAQSGVFQYPGPFALENLTAQIGKDDSAVTLSAARVSGAVDETIGGTFEQARAAIAAVPLDFDQLAGKWSFEGDRLNVSEAYLRVSDRIAGTQYTQARFEPLTAQGATLSLLGNVIEANAALRHPGSGTLITDVAVTHDLGTAEGSASLDVPGVTFGEALELDDLTYLTFGVIASTKGTVSGEGRVSWTAEDITSSGVFGTQGLDLAAAFGPVRGLKGTVRFTDLLSLSTAPDQLIEIASVNPGIEVLDGEVRLTLIEGTRLKIEAARWPFMGGELIMRPTDIQYGTDKEQVYVLEIVGLDAAKFVAQMELTNLSATGTFDGTVPVIFDAVGNGRIAGGLLISRAPGGNVSYVGELTYEDLGAISNYAFQSLRSLDYSQMSVQLGGELTGEILTRFQIDGVRQGAGADRNFITRRLAKLPIRFNVNVRSENFYELATMVRTFFDAESLPDPVDRGILGTDGQRLTMPPPLTPQPAPPPAPDPAPSPEALRPSDTSVQPPESEAMP
ncbi:MAG: YdbH domain-containing protein [Pseudomonadota bacterium]